MLFQIYLTIFVLFALIAGAFWALVRRPLLKRLREEARAAEEERLLKQQQAEARLEAEREISALLDVPSEAAQEEQQLQKEERA